MLDEYKDKCSDATCACYIYPTLRGHAEGIWRVTKEYPNPNPKYTGEICVEMEFTEAQ